MRAAVLIDDVELSAADVAELQYLLPNCGFVLAGRNVGGVMRTVPLTGLTVDAAGELLAHVVGEPVERSVVYALWGVSRGVPAELVIYPREGHGIEGQEIDHQRDAYGRIQSWLMRHLEATAA